MAHRRSRYLPLSALIAATMGLSACGGASTASPHGTGTSSEQSRLAEVSLRHSDLPVGWISTPDPLTPAAAAALKAETAATASCMGIANPWFYQGTTSFQSPLYASPEGTIIAQTITQELPSSGDVASFLAPYANPSYSKCKGITGRQALLSELRSRLASVPGSTLGPLTVTLQPAPALTGPVGSSRLFLSTIDINVPDAAPVQVAEDRVELTRGRVIVQLLVQSTDVALPASLVDQCSRTLYLRMSGASSVTT
jgi:hypothetical protein